MSGFINPAAASVQNFFCPFKWLPSIQKKLNHVPHIYQNTFNTMDLAESIGLAPVDSRDAATGNPSLEEEESILSSFDNVQLILSADSDQGQGKLFITER